MRIQEVKVGELEKLLASSIFSNSQNIPISPLRAIAQQHNPRAEKEDIALLIALDESEELVSYVGCLPDQMAQHPLEKISWNSCWWRHPEKGKRVALPLLLRAIQLWDGRMLFDDLPDHSKQILETLGGFSFREMAGLRCFLKFKFHKIFQGNTLKGKLLYGLDGILNRSWLPLNIYRWSSSQAKFNIRLETITRIDAETERWIENHRQQELIGRGAKDLNWILEYPWMSTKSKDAFSEKYFFSSFAKVFENHVFQLWEKEQLIAVLFFTQRDGQVKLPYIYFDKNKMEVVVFAILKILIQLKAETFTCFQQEVCTAIQQQKTPFYHRKKIVKTFGIAKTLEKYLEESPVIQDGDGDWVFT